MSSNNNTQYRAAPPAALPIKAALSRAAANAACDVGASPLDVHGHLTLSSTPRTASIMHQHETVRPGVGIKQQQSSIAKGCMMKSAKGATPLNDPPTVDASPSFCSQLTKQLSGFSLANTYPLGDPASCTPEELRLGPRAPRAIARLATKQPKKQGGEAVVVPFLGDSCSSHPTAGAGALCGGSSSTGGAMLHGSQLASHPTASHPKHAHHPGCAEDPHAEEIVPAPPVLRRIAVASPGPSSIAGSISPPESPMSQEALDEMWWGSNSSMSCGSSVLSDGDRSAMQPLCVVNTCQDGGDGNTVDLPVLVETLWTGGVHVCRDGVAVPQQQQGCDGAHLIAWATWDPRRCPPQGPLRSRQLLVLLEQRWVGRDPAPVMVRGGVARHHGGGASSSSSSSDGARRIRRTASLRAHNVPTTARLLPYVGGGGQVGGDEEDVELLPMSDVLQHGSQPIGIGGVLRGTASPSSPTPLTLPALPLILLQPAGSPNTAASRLNELQGYVQQCMQPHMGALHEAMATLQDELLQQTRALQAAQHTVNRREAESHNLMQVIRELTQGRTKLVYSRASLQERFTALQHEYDKAVRVSEVSRQVSKENIGKAARMQRAARQAEQELFRTRTQLASVLDANQQLRHRNVMLSERVSLLEASTPVGDDGGSAVRGAWSVAKSMTDLY